MSHCADAQPRLVDGAVNPDPRQVNRVGYIRLAIMVGDRNVVWAVDCDSIKVKVGSAQIR